MTCQVSFNTLDVFSRHKNKRNQAARVRFWGLSEPARRGKMKCTPATGNKPQTPPLEAAGCRGFDSFRPKKKRKKFCLVVAGLVPFGNSIERGPRLRIYRSTKSGVCLLAGVGAESSGKNNSATCVVGRLGSGVRPRSFSRLTKMDVWSHRRFGSSSPENWKHPFAWLVLFLPMKFPFLDRRT
jgi:hypothetical protein